MAQARCFKRVISVDRVVGSIVPRRFTPPPLPPLAKGGTVVRLRPRPVSDRRQIAATVIRYVSAVGLLFASLAAPPRSAFAQTAESQAGKLTVRVLDAATGKNIPARLVVRSSRGDYPGDRLELSASRWPNIEAHGVFISGEETFSLPTGSTSLTAAHGLGYHAASDTIEIEAGKSTTLELRLKRMVDMRRLGWVSGDLHVHMIHGENQRPTSYEDVATTCAANGLDFVSVGQEYVGAGKLDLQGYVAECERVSTADFRMFLGAERPKNLLGHSVLLGVPNPFLIDEDPPYFQAGRAVHEAGGILVSVHPVRYYPGKEWQGKPVDFPGNNLARELVFDAFAGPSFDGLSVLSDEPANATAWQLWFQLLNRGLFVPIFADSDACFDRPAFGIKAPGFWTTYFHVGPEGKIDQPSLVEAVRRGQTMATTGPLLQFRIDDKISGATIPLDGRAHSIEIEAWHAQHAFSLATDDSSGNPVGVAKIELIRNGKIVRTWEPREKHARVTHSVSETEPCWYAVRIFGTDQRWQVGAASPIWFAAKPVAKRAPLTSTVRGRIYDFQSGQERTGTVEIRRGDKLLKSFSAEGQFVVRMPVDAEISVLSADHRMIRKNLLLDYGPVHRFLWFLESPDLGKPETFEMMEHLLQSVDLEFPLGHRMPGSYIVTDLAREMIDPSLRILDGPPRTIEGTMAIAALIIDAEQIGPGDALHAVALFRDEGKAGESGPLVVEARGYDPRRPTAFGALKKFAEFERTWATATDLGDGYRMISGTLRVPDWVEPGPTRGIDLSVRARKGDGDFAWIGMSIPIGPTRRALSLSGSWPTMPVSWPDRNYGIGPFRLCNRIGRAAQPRSDYRTLHLELKLAGQTLDLLPARDGRGCPDSDDAVYVDHFLDQSLADRPASGSSGAPRPQPEIRWRENLQVVDATGE